MGSSNRNDNEQRWECPICKEPKTLRGLHGHLRLKHRKQEKEIVELVGRAPLDRRGDAEEVLNLLDRFKYLDERYAALEIFRQQKCFKTDKIGNALLKTLNDEANEIWNCLSEKGLILDNQSLEAYCKMFRLTEDVQTEEEQEEE